MIFQHPDYVQSFDKDRLVLADDLCGEFLKRVSPGVADFGVESGYFQSGLLAIVTALDLARQAALKPLQSLFSPDERARIFELFALAGRGQRLNANVYAYFGFGLLKWLDVGFDQNADKMASSCVSADGKAKDFCILRQQTTPRNIERRGVLGQRDLSISKAKSIGGIARRLAVASGFEFGILRSLLEEIREGGIEIAERLLKNNRTDLRKKGPVRLLFPLGKFRCGFVIANGFLLLPPGRGAQLQCLIVNIPGATEGSGQLLGLFISGEESVFESLFNYHAYIFYIRSMRFLSAVNRGRSARDAKFISIQACGYGWSILWRI